jgi:iron-sulfur cluster assembly protein
MNDVLTGNATKGLSLTESAIAEVKRLRTSQHMEGDKFLRIGVKGGGCAGFSYVMEFDTIKPGDIVYEQEGEKILVDLMHDMYLNGTVVDFGTGLNARGFTYSNPNATKTCGCGESFG